MKIHHKDTKGTKRFSFGIALPSGGQVTHHSGTENTEKTLLWIPPSPPGGGGSPKELLVCGLRAPVVILLLEPLS